MDESLALRQSTDYPPDPRAVVDAERAARLLRDARLRAGLSLRNLAARAQTSHSALAAYEQGRRVPGITTFMRLLDACDMAVDVQISPRVRRAAGLERGDELAAVLRLAGQFPVRESGTLNYPLLARLKTR